MGTLFGFVVGYIIGARAGSESFDEVVDALRDIRESEEVRAFVQVLKSHMRSTAVTVSQRLAGADHVATAEERVAQARRRAGAR